MLAAGHSSVAVTNLSIGIFRVHASPRIANLEDAG